MTYKGSLVTRERDAAAGAVDESYRFAPHKPQKSID